MHPATVSAEAARRLLMHAQGLLADPARRATPATVGKQIEALGFVQIDSINVVERAHHLTLASRFDGYEKQHLVTLLEKRRRLFEHWTHDASAIPVQWFPHWRLRCATMAEGRWFVRWCREKMGPRWQQVVEQVLARVRADGQLASRDFDSKRPRGVSASWWGWKPAKAALEYLWRRGDISITRRVNFQKVYDLTERVFPELHGVEPPTLEDYRAWACETALTRLGVATPAEIAGFWGAVTLDQARTWCKAAVEADQAVPVRVESMDGARPRPAFAVSDWRRRAGRARAALAKVESCVRLLSPFDPVLRDRARAQRLFDFEYRFEAFVPEAKRRYGYYVLPVLGGEQLVGRCDLKFDRGAGALLARGLWWEAGVKPARRPINGLRRALGRTARLIGAAEVRGGRGLGTFDPG